MDVINDLWTDDCDGDDEYHMKYYETFKDREDKIGFAIACRDVEGLKKLLGDGDVATKFLEDACTGKSAACLVVLLDRCDFIPDNLVDICIRHREPACLAEVLKRVRPTATQVHDMAFAFMKETFVKLMADVLSS
jgi:hypothetical protein